MPARRLRPVMFVLTALGAALAAYLTYTHYAHVKVACTLGTQCETVQHSAYASVGGVPVALLGLGGYAAILVAVLIPDTDGSRLALLALTAVGFGFSAYLTYRELFTIHAVCQWCIGSAVVMTALAASAAAHYVRADAVALD